MLTRSFSLWKIKNGIMEVLRIVVVEYWRGELGYTVRSIMNLTEYSANNLKILVKSLF